MKLKLKSTLNFDFCFVQSLFDLETAIEVRQVYKRFIKLPITLLFWHDRLYSSRLLDSILSRAKARDKFDLKRPEPSRYRAFCPKIYSTLRTK